MCLHLSDLLWGWGRTGNHGAILNPIPSFISGGTYAWRLDWDDILSLHNNHITLVPLSA